MTGTLLAIGNHLWQSTLFGVGIALLTLVFRRYRAQNRYWLWLAASVKFLIPFSWLVAAGRRIHWRSAQHAVPIVSRKLEQIGRPFPSSLETANYIPATVSSHHIGPLLLGSAWLLGFAAVLAIWFGRWRRLHAIAESGIPFSSNLPIPVVTSPAPLEPGIFGIFRPVLILPEGIQNRVSPAQLQAILAHEVSHAKRRDNLAALIHMAVEAVFWFHPMTWWIGSRMVEERERACDEEVLSLGNQPEVYAEGILNVCRFYLESPLTCAAGMTGADLKKRIEAIMTDRVSVPLTLARKMLLTAAGVLAVAGPVVIGIIHVSPTQAQPAALRFEVATIKPCDPNQQEAMMRMIPGGGLEISGLPLKQIVAFAYDVRSFQVDGGPSWINSDKYNITAKAGESESPVEFRKLTEEQRDRLGEQVRQRLQSLLAERFQLTLQHSTKEMNVYALMIAKGGHKLQPPEQGKDGRQGVTGRKGEIQVNDIALPIVAHFFSNQLGRPVIDKTGLTGHFNFKLNWTPNSGPNLPPGSETPSANASPSTTGPSLFTALQEQAGLKLESQKAPVEIIMIERAEKPSAN